jgi:hypothetical protein
MRILLLITLILWTSLGIAQEKLITPQSEIEHAIVFLGKVEAEKRPYIRFFTTYAVPEQNRNKCALSLSFILHSLTGVAANVDDGNAGAYYPLALSKDETGKDIEELQLVPGTKTLWWIDLRDYNFTEQAWENMSVVDGYFVEPILDHRSNGLLRLIAGNAIVRADWFIVHASDLTLQSDQNIKNPIYYELLYAQNKIPKNISEFRDVWGLNLKEAIRYGNEHAVIVSKSKAVAPHNRALFRYRTHLGYLYETFDVKFQSGLRDYVESFNKYKGRPPTVSDAGEAFATNAVHMQVYALRNAQGGLIDFADPQVARHITDVVGDVRVRTPHSCMDCHSAGPIPPENTIREFIEKFGKVQVPDKRDQYRIDRVYLSGRFEEGVSEDQRMFASAMKKVNGLEPEINAQAYLDTVRWYYRDLDLKQAAFECGVTEETFKKKLLESTDINGNRRISARLGLLLTTGEGVPRNIWDNRGADGVPGLFQQAMIAIHGYTKITTEQVQRKKELVWVVNKPCTIYHGNDKLPLETGTIINLGKHKQDGWVTVSLRNRDWWIKDSNLTKEERYIE